MRDLIGDRQLFARGEHRLNPPGERAETLRRGDPPCDDTRCAPCELHVPRLECIDRDKTLADVL